MFLKKPFLHVTIPIMTPERVIINNPVYSETIKNGLSLLERYQTEHILHRVQDKLWRCGEIVTNIDEESQTVSYLLQKESSRDTTNSWGCITEEYIEWIEICPEGDLLTINSNRSPTPLISLNPRDLSQKELEETIYKILEKDSDNRNFGRTMNLKLAAFGFGLEPNNSERFNVRDDDPQIDIPNRS